jgi:hypothetical protein
MGVLVQFFRRLFGKPARSRKRKRTVVLLSALLLALPVAAQTLPPEAESQIQDNSFLIEEAYNQDPGVVQHIQTFSRATRGGDWIYTFTQEWPVPAITHQLSYTLPMLRIDGARGIGDVALNYRYQLIGDSETRIAVAPRLTLLLPAGNERRGLGSGGTGVQVMLPISTVLTPALVAHWNLGATITPKTHTHNLTAGNSFVWLANHRFNVLVETLWSRTSDRGGHDSQTTVNPGIRWSYDFPSKLQIVPGIAFPITNHGGGKSVFLYLSFEHPFVTQP